jgi:hypothetical protein
MNLGEAAEVQMGYPFRSRLEHDPRGDVAVIQMKDIDDSDLLHVEGAIRVVLPQGKAHHLLRAGDLLFRSRGRNNSVAQVQNGIGAAVLSAPMLLIRPQDVLPAYLCWYLNSPATEAQLAALAEGTSVRMISAEGLKTLEVPVPAKAIQQRIAEAAVLAAQEQLLLARMADLRQRMITRALLQRAQQTN